MRAHAAGEAVLVLTAKSRKDGASSWVVVDALELRLPVRGVQPRVRVGTSVALTASPNPSLWREGIALPDAVPGSGELTMAAGLGWLSAVSAAAQELMRAPRVSSRTDAGASRGPYAPELLGALGALAVLHPYGGDATHDADVARSELEWAVDELQEYHTL